MRLPGTFNLGGRNHLPTAEFLIRYEKLKRAKAQAKLEREANGDVKDEFGDKSLTQRVASTSKKDGGDATKGERPKVVTTPDGDTFTKAQDDTIIQLKMEGKTWAMIGIEIGKAKGAVSARFKDIKPADFDVKEKEWKEKNGGGGQSQGNKQKVQTNQNHQNNQNENKGHQSWAEKGNNSQNQNDQQQQSKKNKNNQQNNQNQNNNKNWKKQEGTQAEAGADDDKASETGTWAVADENFTEKEVTVLEKIVEIELRNAFVRIASSFASHPAGKKVHPDSIAQKVLGEGLDLSSLRGSS